MRRYAELLRKHVLPARAGMIRIYTRASGLG